MVLLYLLRQGLICCPPNHCLQMLMDTEDEQGAFCVAAGAKGRCRRQIAAPTTKVVFAVVTDDNKITIVIVTVAGELASVSYTEPSSLLADTFAGLTTTWPGWGGDGVPILQLRQLGLRGAVTCLRPHS